MKKNFVLVVVVGILLVLVILSLTSLYLLNQQTSLTEHKIKRMRAYYAGQAGLVLALENLRKGIFSNTTFYLGAGYPGYPPAGLEVNITRNIGAGILGTDEVKVRVKY